MGGNYPIHDEVIIMDVDIIARLIILHLMIIGAQTGLLVIIAMGVKK